MSMVKTIVYRYIYVESFSRVNFEYHQNKGN
jgi:hypothetical protein